MTILSIAEAPPGSSAIRPPARHCNRRARSLSSHRMCWLASARTGVPSSDVRVASPSAAVPPRRCSTSSDCRFSGPLVSRGYSRRNNRVHSRWSRSKARPRRSRTIGSAGEFPSTPPRSSRYRWTAAVVWLSFTKDAFSRMRSRGLDADEQRVGWRKLLGVQAVVQAVLRVSVNVHADEQRLDGRRSDRRTGRPSFTPFVRADSDRRRVAAGWGFEWE